MGSDEPIAKGVDENKKSHAKSAWGVLAIHQRDLGNTKRQAIYPVEYRFPYRKFPICAAGAEASSRAKPFVCHSTPHIDSTSREVPTLFFLIIHEIYGKVNPYFHNFHRL